MGVVTDAKQVKKQTRHVRKSRSTRSIKIIMMPDGQRRKLARLLVVDTAGFIKNVAFDDYAEEVVTLEEVVAEIRDKETRNRLKSNPLDIEYKYPDDTSVSKIIEFSRKTGDYGSLSLTDVKVMALALMLEVEAKGSDSHLRAEPKIRRTENFYKPAKEMTRSAASKIAGFYMAPPGDHQVEVESGDEEGGEWTQVGQKGKKKMVFQDEGSSDDDEESSSGEEEFQNEEEEEEVNDEDEGWITPANIIAKKKAMGLEHELGADQEQVEVACMTSDFAMQNVLIQLGLNVASPYGCQLIKETKTWILRCYACKETTPDMTKKFCPRCGNPTLKRVTVTLNEDGSQQIHINSKRQLTARGKKFSLPAPKGGKYAVNPVLTADGGRAGRHSHQVTKMARSKTNAMDPDYVAGNDPFSKNDVTSKSAMIGVGHHARPYWECKNPNDLRKRTGNNKRKKKV